MNKFFSFECNGTWPNVSGRFFVFCFFNYKLLKIKLNNEECAF